MNRTAQLRSLPPRRRGVALLLVLGVVVMASVLGYAMLSSAAMSRQATTNASASASAQSLAESGVNLALYYLNNPGSSPTYPTSYPATETYDRARGFWQGTDGQFVDFGSPSIGQVKVTVTRPNEAVRWQYQIESLGRALGSTIERRAKVTVFVNSEYRFDHATLTTYDASWPGYSRVDGDAYSNGGLSLRALTTAIVGRGTRRKNTATAVLPTKGWQSPPPLVPKIVPTFSEVRSYLTYEMPAGQLRNATVLSTTNLGTSGVSGVGAAGVLLEPTADNPAGVFYAPEDLTIHADTEIRGTLIVGRNLSLVGNNVRIRSQPGFPALVVGGNVTFGSLLTLTPAAYVHGVTYVGGRIDGTMGVVPTFEVDGALLVGGTSPIFPTLPTAYLRVRYNQEIARIADFSEVGRTPISIKTLHWEDQ